MRTARLTPVLQYLRDVRGSGGTTGPDDAGLLEQFTRQGDGAAFTGLVRRHGPMVLGVCRRVLRDRHEAEDAFQATFLLLARKAGSLRRPDLLGPWLYGVAYRTALKARSLAARRPAPLGPGEDWPADLPPDDLVWRDLRPVLDEVINQLPEKYRAPFVLCYLEGRTNAQAARELGCPPGTVATHLARAREQLRARLTRRGLTLSAALLAAALARGATSAAVPAALLAATARVAPALLAGAGVPTGAIPAKVAALTEGVAKAMFMDKVKVVVAALLALGAAAAGGGTLAYKALAAEPARAEEARPVPPPAIPPTVREAAAEPPSGHRTPNFVVEAPTRRVAQLVAEAAEQQRKAQALRWLGEEMPPWPEPCRIRVSFAPAAPLVGVARPASGTSTFAFDKGKVQRPSMELQGPLDQLLSSTLPHEITHIVLAHHFGEAVPRWADEGAAVLAEDEEDRRRHDDLARQVLAAPKRRIPLRRLLPMRDYPEDVMALFAEGYALTRFLVERKDPATFLAFVKQGMRDGWDQAARAHYGYEDVEALEKDLVAKVGSPPGTALVEGASLPARQPPWTVLAVMNEARVVVRMPGTVYEPRTSYVRREGEPERAVTSYVRVAEEEVREFAAGDMQAYSTDGERIGAKALAGLLRKQTAVLFAPDGRMPDPFYLELVKEGTLILVPPVPRPATAPAAPPLPVLVEPPPRRGN